HVIEWAMTHPEDLLGRRDGKGAPANGWAGHWNRDQISPWSFLGLIPARLRKILTDGGYEYEPTVQGWKDRGWLLVDRSDKTKLHHQATLDGEKPRLIA